MKLIDAIKQEGSPFKIPECSRDELPLFFKELGFKTGAEIGVDHGDFTEKFSNVGLEMYAIDNWEKRNTLYKRVKIRFYKNNNVHIIRKTSMEAVLDFPSRSLDFVYIDADHRFPFIAQDLYYWYWRVKRGGIIAGHDYKDTRPDSKYRSIQIQTVVDAFVKTHFIKNFYIFGRSKKLADEERDNKMLSFMFFRK